MKQSRILIVVFILIVCKFKLSNQASAGDAQQYSYLDQARKLLDLGMEVQSYSRALPKEDPNSTQMLRDSVNKATVLINNYRQNGLNTLPNLPNFPGVSTVMRIPDKLLRAELSMLQDEIRMAQKLMENPLTATMDAPRDLAAMFSRMLEQFEQ